MSKRILQLLGALAVFVAAPLAAQTPTPEGTVITNNVQVNYTDVNGNTYAPATSSVSVTVGFIAGLDVTSPGTVTPASPSTANEIVFTIANIGNGPDTVSVTTAAGTGITITGYKIGATTYATLALLNAALQTTEIAGITGTVDVTVVYNVAALLGGETRVVTLTATSDRDNSESDASSTNVSPPVAGTVTVTPVTASINRVPGGATPYSTTFTVTNGTNTTVTFDLTGTNGGTGVTTGLINGGTSTVTIAGNTSTTVTVEYTVGPGTIAAGTTGTVVLTATAQGAPSINGSGTHTVTVVKPALSLVKEAFMADGTTAITASDRVTPGQTIVYKLTITNNGSAAAHNVVVTDQLPAQLQYVGHTAPSGWAGAYVAGTTTFTGTLTPPATMAISQSAVITISATVK